MKLETIFAEQEANVLYTSLLEVIIQFYKGFDGIDITREEAEDYLEDYFIHSSGVTASAEILQMLHHLGYKIVKA